MSAIVGIYQVHDEQVANEHGRGMMEALQRYPADRVGTWHADHVFLGCHAQWITPESVNEILPYYDSDRQLAITADAIIDNRMELFEKLQIINEDRRTIPDSLLILLAYQKWGEETPKHLIGDFAFMIWDGRERRLFGARDFSGSRTLYYHRTNQIFAFCTVIRPLFSLPDMKRELNEQWLAEFLAIPGMNDAVDTGSTVYKYIEQIPPSHSIVVREGRVKLTRYCTLTAGKLRLKSDSEYVEAFREVFRDAVTARVRTYRQVGAHLSGGLDSGSVVSFASRALHKLNKPLHTFSSIPTDDFVDWTPKHVMADERPLISSTVKHVGNVKDHYFNFEGRNSLSEVDDLLDVMEMPYKFFENSYWYKGIYEKAHQEGVGVILTGARGNSTISWGPPLDYMAQQLKRNWVRYLSEVYLYSRNMGFKKSRVLKVTGRKAFPLLSKIFGESPSLEFPRLISPELARRTHISEKMKENGIDVTGLSSINAFEARKRHFDDLYTWNTTNTISTKLSLHYSLRERDPTNDIRVVRFCLSLPSNQFVRNGVGRTLIRRASENYLPDNVRLNQRVRGIQGADWVYRMIPSWSTYTDELELLSKDERIFDYFNKQVVLSAISKAKEGPRPENAFDPEYRILMRCLIVNRFIKSQF